VSNAYNDYSREIVVAHQYGWEPQAKLWLPYAMDAAGHQQVDIANGSIVAADNWHPNYFASTTGASSNKVFTVPAGLEWQVCTIRVVYTSTATVGTRQIGMQYEKGDGTIVTSMRAGATQTASLTRIYTFGLGLMDMTSFRDTDYLSMPLPVVVLPAGYVVRVWDKAAIAAAADSMSVYLMVVQRPV
jgi:hypothetical protein